MKNKTLTGDCVPRKCPKCDDSNLGWVMVCINTTDPDKIPEYYCHQCQTYYNGKLEEVY